MITVQIQKFNDPGHGWFSLSLSEIKKLEQKTSFELSALYESVVVNPKATRIYFEEDCEGSPFFSFLEQNNIKISLTKNYHGNKQSRIRGYGSISVLKLKELGKV
jgi:hypothetical protein